LPLDNQTNMADLIYNLPRGLGSSGEYYDDLKITSNHFIHNEVNSRVKDMVVDFRTFVYEERIEKVRSFNEYLLEFLFIGISWQSYAEYASNLTPSTKILTNFLYSVRSHSKTLKPVTDRIRGVITTSKLLRRQDYLELMPSLDNLRMIVAWLDATKDFNEEVKRLEAWIDFLKSKSPIYIANVIKFSLDISKKFNTVFTKYLGKYTTGVEPFLKSTTKVYKNREDAIFCRRTELHYFFNMFAAEILNRAMFDRFQRTKEKFVLLPTCMSSPESGICKARVRGLDIECTGCSANCKVNRINKMLKGKKVDVKLLPRSSDFSKWIKRWQDNQEVGLVRVACVLNLLSGGYGMMSLNIPSQFVFLDYSGCKKHWPTVAQPTATNIDQLMVTLYPGYQKEQKKLKPIAPVPNRMVKLPLKPAPSELPAEDLFEVLDTTFSKS